MPIKFRNIKKLCRYYLSKLYDDTWYWIAFFVTCLISLSPLLIVFILKWLEPNLWNVWNEIMRENRFVLRSVDINKIGQYSIFDFCWCLIPITSFVSVYVGNKLNWGAIWKLLGASVKQKGESSSISRETNESGEESLIISFFPTISRQEMVFSKLLVYLIFSFINYSVFFNLLMIPFLIMAKTNFGLNVGLSIVLKTLFFTSFLLPLVCASSFLSFFYFRSLNVALLYSTFSNISPLFLFFQVILKLEAIMQNKSWILWIKGRFQPIIFFGQILSGIIFFYLYWQEFETEDIN